MPNGRLSPDELMFGVWDAAPATITVSGTSARNSSDLTIGKVYYLIATTDLCFLQGDSSVTATTSSNYLPAGGIATIKVTATGNARVAVIQLNAGGTAYIQSPNGA